MEICPSQGDSSMTDHPYNEPLHAALRRAVGKAGMSRHASRNMYSRPIDKSRQGS
jgi:hypothetical protein